MTHLPFRMAVSFWSDLLPLLFSFVLIGVMLWLCYVASRYASKKISVSSRFQNIKVVERLALGQDKGLVIAQICGVYYLMGYSEHRIEILKELDGGSLQLPEKTDVKQDFQAMLDNLLKGRQEGKQHGGDKPSGRDPKS